MKRTIVAMAVLAAAGIAAVLAYQDAARERLYRALIARGEEALAEDQTSAAIEAFSGAITLRPDSMLAHRRRGEAYRRRSAEPDLGAAARDFQKAAQIDPSAPRPLEELADVLYQRQRYDRAVSAYEKSVHLDDRSARVSYKLALAHYRGGQTDAALAALDQTLRLDDRMADAHYLRGLCLREKAQTAGAVKAFEKAVSLSPALIPAREELADLYRDLGRRADALEQLQLLAGLDRDHVERHVAVGLAHAQARHWDAAVLTLRSVLERMPEDPVLYRALGQVWLASANARDDRVDLSKAREALERVASRPGATSEVLMLSGQAALEDGDLEAAERALQQATTRFPLNPQALMLYATVAERQNHFDNARRALIEYGALVADDADFVARAARIAALSLRLKDRPTAAEWIARGLKRDPENALLSGLKLKTETSRSSPSTSDQSRRATRRPEN